MGFKISWDVDKIIHELRICNAQVNSSYNDGFSAWRCKKDLLTVKYALDEMLAESPTFSHLELEFHNEQAKKKTWQILNKK